MNILVIDIVVYEKNIMKGKTSKTTFVDWSVWHGLGVGQRRSGLVDSCRCLLGRLEAYIAMYEERSVGYEDLREALLEKFDISAETYRKHFWKTSSKPGETPRETYHRLKGLYAHWIRPQQHTKEEIGELIILEQLLRVLPYDVYVGEKA